MVSIGFSLLFACATPFAALAALSAMTLSRNDGLAAVSLTWMINQLIGYGILGYPADPMTMAWGVAILLSAVAALVAAWYALALLAKPLVRAIAAIMTALVAQQLTIYAASLILTSHPSAFSSAVLWQIAWTNLLGFVVLLSLHWIGLRLNWVRSPRPSPA